MNSKRKKKGGAVELQKECEATCNQKISKRRQQMNIDDEKYLQETVAARIADDKYSKELPYNMRGWYIIAQALYSQFRP